MGFTSFLGYGWFKVEKHRQESVSALPSGVGMFGVGEVKTLNEALR